MAAPLERAVVDTEGLLEDLVPVAEPLDAGACAAVGLATPETAPVNGAGGAEAEAPTPTSPPSAC